MRFAWLRTKVGQEPVAAPRGADRALFVAYNVVWWVPPVLAFGGIVSYRVGFIAFLAVTVVRALANLYRNNVLSVEAAEQFPYRSP